MSDYWAGKSGIVTGAASGIGLALSKALLARGAHVWMADLDLAAVTRAAVLLGGPVSPVALDVRDAGAVRRVVEAAVSAAGRIDFLFNNAGIGIGGEMHDLAVEHFDRIIDVNIRGVVNGVVAAYPLMVKQRSGHIVNTASLAGLTPVPLLAPYAMTKHAVVGLSTSLRAEARRHGVRVSVICPAAIETPLLDANNPVDLPALPWRGDVRRYLERLAGPPASADRLADAVLHGLERDQGMIIFPARARVVSLLQRLFPGLVGVVVQQALAAELASRPKANSA
jgi:NAD(P)-dependent dehydrogenase (short-subunit alcohol dehydrogenase family)